MRKIFFILSLVSLFTSSCLTRKQIAYFQDSNNEHPLNSVKTDIELQKFEPLISPKDILSIFVTSLSPEASSFFNNAIVKTNSENFAGLAPAVGYLVDVNGNIEMPLIGKVKVGGLTTSQATDLIKSQLEKFLLSPSVRLYFENYRVTILGEVSRPGVYQVPNEKITLPEALGLAGDLTAYGKRDNILIIREDSDKKSFARLDIRNIEIFASPYYYLHPNDVIYVEPNKGKAAQADAFFRIAPIVISTLTLAAVIYTTATR